MAGRRIWPIPACCPNWSRIRPLICVEYNDGTRATLLVLHGADRNFTFSARVAGHGLIATQFFRVAWSQCELLGGPDGEGRADVCKRNRAIPGASHFAHQRHFGGGHDVAGPDLTSALKLRNWR